MFSYGEDNEIDFDRCEGVVGLFSPNASGKSSILDALTFCLFDKSTRAWKAENVMNHSKSNFRCKLEFDVGNDSYVIERKGRVLRHGSTRVDVDFYKFDEIGNKVSLNGDQRNSTNKNIRKLIGTYDDFIMTSFSAQNEAAIFLEQNQTEKKEILGKFLGLSVFDQLYKIAKEESSGLQSMLKNFLDVDYDQQISDIETEINQVSDVIVKLETSQNKKEIWCACGAQLKNIFSNFCQKKPFQKSSQNCFRDFPKGIFFEISVSRKYAVTRHLKVNPEFNFLFKPTCP